MSRFSVFVRNNLKYMLHQLCFTIFCEKVISVKSFMYLVCKNCSASVAINFCLSHHMIYGYPSSFKHCLKCTFIFEISDSALVTPAVLWWITHEDAWIKGQQKQPVSEKSKFKRYFNWTICYQSNIFLSKYYIKLLL